MMVFVQIQRVDIFAFWGNGFINPPGDVIGQNDMRILAELFQCAV